MTRRVKKNEAFSRDNATTKNFFQKMVIYASANDNATRKVILENPQKNFPKP